MLTNTELLQTRAFMTNRWAYTQVSRFLSFWLRVKIGYNKQCNYKYYCICSLRIPEFSYLKTAVFVLINLVPSVTLTVIVNDLVRVNSAFVTCSPKPKGDI